MLGSHRESYQRYQRLHQKGYLQLMPPNELTCVRIDLACVRQGVSITDLMRQDARMVA